MSQLIRIAYTLIRMAIAVRPLFSSSACGYGEIKAHIKIPCDVLGRSARPHSQYRFNRSTYAN